MKKQKNSNIEKIKILRNPKAKKHRNISKNIPNGLILLTRDEYFENDQNYRKPGYEKRGNYRKTIVVDSNKLNELIVVKGSTNGIDLKIPGIKAIKPYARDKDNEHNPIKISNKFINSNKKISESNVNKIKKHMLTKERKSVRLKNKKLFRNLKKRK